MIILLAAAATAAPTAAPACSVSSGNGYTASLIAPVVMEAPLPPKPVVVAKRKPVAKVHKQRARLSLGCALHKKAGA